MVLKGGNAHKVHYLLMSSIVWCIWSMSIRGNLLFLRVTYFNFHKLLKSTAGSCVRLGGPLILWCRICGVVTHWFA